MKDPKVFVNFLKVHNITEKADVAKLAEIYATILCEHARKVEQEFKKNKELESRTGTPCFGLYHTRMVLNAVELAGCIILSYGTQTVDCYEDYVDDQEQAEVNFAKCLEETYP